MRKLLLTLFLIAAPLSANSLLLDSTSKSLELVTSSSASVDWVVSWADHTATTFDPGMSQGNVASATDTTIAAAPASSTQRQVKWVSVRNRSTTTANTVAIQLDVSGTEYVVGPDVTLAAGESLRWDAEGALEVFTANGLRKERSTDASGYGGTVLSWWKAGTASEAAARWYYYTGVTGLPGAWVPGTPGLDGYRTDCSDDTNSGADPAGATELGAPHLPNPSSGSYYLTNMNANASVANVSELIDVLWYNTGTVATTTTAQGITMPGALPSRDAEGTSDGEGVNAAIYVETATTNGSAITNTTLSYTNSDGTNSRTATIPNFPATAVAGTFVPFALEDGDRGIKDIASITLGTSYGSGVISLVLYRVIGQASINIANVGSIMQPVTVFDQPGIRIYNGTCFWYGYLSSTTTATTGTLTVTIMER